MRVYTESSEETLRARRLLKEWTGDGLLSGEQHQRLEPETVSDLRTTNVFLRLVLLFFTVIAVAATVGLFFTVFLSRPSQETSGVFLLIFAGVCYAGAEVAVAQAHLYRYGIEEALCVCSVALLCVGLGVLFSVGAHSSREALLVVAAAGTVSSLWIWHRFGLWYSFLAAMIFVLFLPGYWTTSPWAQHGFVSALYAAGLVCIAAVGSRCRYDSLAEAYSLAEAFLWLGIYLALNLQITALNLPSGWWGDMRGASEFTRPFYWATWVLVWCLPPLILARGIRRKDRFVLAAGGIAAVLTFVTNKPYLGWQRHTWDPMLLGILLTGVACYLRRWLERGPGGVRHGFTAARLSGRDKHVIGAGSSLLGLVSPQAIVPGPQPHDGGFGGGSGGAGASGDF